MARVPHWRALERGWGPFPWTSLRWPSEPPMPPPTYPAAPLKPPPSLLPPLPRAQGEGGGPWALLPLPPRAPTQPGATRLWGFAEGVWGKAAPNRQSGEEVTLLRNPEISVSSERVGMFGGARVSLLGGGGRVLHPAHGCGTRRQAGPESEPPPSIEPESMHPHPHLALPLPLLLALGLGNCPTCTPHSP